MDASGNLYKRYVLTGKTLQNCQARCDAVGDECRGINFLADVSDRPGHCHINVDAGVAVGGQGSNIHGDSRVGVNDIVIPLPGKKLYNK